MAKRIRRRRAGPGRRRRVGAPDVFATRPPALEPDRIRPLADVDASPVLALDMYEHAYHLDFRANTTAYVDAFMRNIDWTVVVERTRAARDDRPPVREHGAEDALPSLSVEELSAQLAKGERVQVLDARPRHYFSKATDMMQGAVWRIRSGLRNGSASYRPTRSSSCPAPTGTTSVAA